MQLIIVLTSLDKEWKRRAEEGTTGNPYEDVVEGLEKTGNVVHLTFNNEGMITDKALDVFS